MKKHKKRRIWSLITVSLFTFHFSLFTSSCTTSTYDDGDGDYSYLRADFVEAHTVAPQQIDYAINDEGEKISFSTPFAVKWTEKADTFNQKYIIRHADNARQPWEWNLRLLFNDALADRPMMPLEALQNEVMSLSGIKQPKYYDKVFTLAVGQRVVQTTLDSNGRVVAITIPS